MKVQLLAPVAEQRDLDAVLNDSASAPAEAPFSDARVECCVRLSRAIFEDAESRVYPELQALAFSLRKAELLPLRDAFAALNGPNIYRAPRGTIFHIPPGNVDTIFVYSWVQAFLTGNRNVVRLSTKSAPQASILCRLLRDVLVETSGQYFIQYGHEPEITAALSLACDVRVIWGGDQTIRAIREFPLPVHAKELTFPDRYSLSAISAAEWLAASEQRRAELGRHFYNDLFWFDQMACSSPRLLVWCGPEDDCRHAAAGFWEFLRAEIDRRGYRAHPSARMEKLLFACRAIIDQPVTACAAAGPQLTVLELSTLAGLRRESCEGGMILQFQASTLADVAPHIRRQDQTLTYFGFPAAELRAFAVLLQGRGIDRIVPIGQALSFNRNWDGYDLLAEMTSAVSIA